LKIETVPAHVQSFMTEGPCGYYPETRHAQPYASATKTMSFSVSQITRILNKGYRRFGPDYYRTFCRGCNECTPYRVLAGEFKPNRAFRRVLGRNQKAVVQMVTAQSFARESSSFMSDISSRATKTLATTRYWWYGRTLPWR
jgi:arginyl-tRNA--protein-N-Asp/Glu arginylyltransferase